MDDEADVRLVNTHAEGDGGDNDVNLLRKEKVLVLRAGFGVQAGMVRTRLDTVDGQQLGHFLHLLAAEAVDDAALAGILTDEADDIFLRLHLVAHLIIKVGPIEGGLEHRGVLDAQVLEDIALHLGGGRSGKGDHRSRLNLVDDGAYLAVFRPEIMPPFGDTVRLVHGIERNLDRLQKGDVLFLGEGFRSHVQEFGHPPQEVFLHLGNLDTIQRGIQKVGNPVIPGFETADSVHLVLHQGDERGNHNSGALHDQGGKLVTERLAPAGWHKDKCVIAGNQVLDDTLLVSLECIESEESFQFRMQGGGINQIHSSKVLFIRTIKFTNFSKQKPVFRRIICNILCAFSQIFLIFVSWNNVRNAK